MAIPAYADTFGHGFAYVWADQPTTDVGVSYTPHPIYQRNSTGRTNTITRSGTGSYVVSLPGLGPGGTALVTAYGGPSWRPDDRCKVRSWTTSRRFPSLVPTTAVSVGCFNRLGVAVDSLFTLSYTIPVPSSVQARAAYLWNDQPTAPVGAWSTPNTGYQFNSFGVRNTVFHQATGEYLVRLPGPGHPAKQGRFQVQVTGFGTPSADPSAWCDLDGDASDDADGLYLVVCTSASGLPIDAGFTLTAVEGASFLLAGDTGTYANVGCSLVTDAGVPPYYSCNVGHDTPDATVDALGDGKFLVHLPADLSNGDVQVTTWFAGSNRQDPTRGLCKIANWLRDSGVQVNCFDQFGRAPGAATFTVGFVA